MIKLRLRGVSRTVNWDDPLISMCQCDSTIEFTACKTKGHIKTFQRYFDSLSHKRLPVVVYHFNWGWWFDIECYLMGQHDALKKYWQPSQYAETLQVVISEDGGRITNAISMTQHQNCTQSNNQWLDIPVPYTTSQKSRHNVGLQPIFLTEKQRNICWQRKNLRCMIQN